MAIFGLARFKRENNFYVGLRAPTGLTSDLVITLPGSLPTATHALTIDSSGVISTQAISGGGTVSSVALSMPGLFSVSGSPITSTGTFLVELANQAAGTFLAGPTTAGPSVPAFRAIAYSDLSAIVGQGASTLAAGNDSRFHSQGTDSGTSSQTFSLHSGSANPLLLKNSTGVLELRNGADTGFVNLVANNLVLAATPNAAIEAERGANPNVSLVSWDEPSGRVISGVVGEEKPILRYHRLDFTNSSLVSGLLSVTHQLNNTAPLVQIYDNQGQQLLAGVTVNSANAITIDLTPFGAISGTWRLMIAG